MIAAVHSPGSSLSWLGKIAVIFGALSLGLLMAAEPERTQPMLMPMPELLRQLDKDQEWMFLPLLEYQDLVNKGNLNPKVPDVGPHGAWIETAQLRGQWYDDYVLVVADCIIVNTSAESMRCLLFRTRPTTFSAPVFCNQQGLPALTSANAQGGLDLIIPASTRQQVHFSYRAKINQESATIPLPEAIGLDIEFSAERDGVCSGPGLVALGQRRWTVTQRHGSEVTLHWRPGASTGTQALWGLQQAVQIMVPDAHAALLNWRWAAHIDRRSGAVPDILELRFPETWVASTPGAGVHSVRTRADGITEIHLDPKVEDLSLDGFCGGQAIIALPEVQGAHWQGGRITVSNPSGRDWTIPASWRPTETELDDATSYRVPGPGSELGSHLDLGLQWVLSQSTVTTSEVVRHQCAAGPKVWRLISSFHIEFGDETVFSLPLHSPSGWNVVSSSVPDQVTVSQEQEMLTLTCAQGFTAYSSLDVEFTYEHEAQQGPFALSLPSLVNAGHREHGLVLYSAPSIDLHIFAPIPWRNVRGDNDLSLPREEMRAQLRMQGEPLAVEITALARPASCEAEAVLYLQPMDDRKPPNIWGRLDIRLDVRDGDLGNVVVDFPFQEKSEHLSHSDLTLERVGQRLHLITAQPWRGRRILRIEGQLIHHAGDAVTIPKLSITDASDKVIRLKTMVVIQVPGDLDVVHHPGAGAEMGDEDDIPAWSSALPGEPVMAVWRLRGQETGSFTLVRRDLLEPPEGFIHDVRVRTQVLPSGIETSYAFRVAAPQRSSLPLDIPAGSELIAASIDGKFTAIRSVGGRAVLPLPGRTRVDVVIRCRQKAPGSVLEMPLPLFDHIPVVSTSWMLALDPSWVATTAIGSQIMPLRAETAPAYRPWWGQWQPAVARIDGEQAIIITPHDKQDPRQLSPLSASSPSDEPLPVPELTLIGHMWSGHRLGGDSHLFFKLVTIDSLRRFDRLGLGLACIFAALLVWRQRFRTAVAGGISALAGAAALHGLQLSVGPVLACAEWLLPAILGMVCLRAAGRFILASLSSSERVS